ncbi:gluconokinase/shikimate kinase [Frankineae bacterium MT45]|nr:gluconokinase/shikimate kinase [Frankineae bacterium MT45]
MTANDERPPLVLVIMGVSGSGKSTVAGILAGRLGWELAEGDDMHPPANVAKMAAGHPLEDEDRWPWLDTIADWIHQHEAQNRPGIITCSALKKRYRDRLRGDRVIFILLAGGHDQIAARLTARHGHFMPSSLLQSQFETLEPPTPDERSLTVSVGETPQREAAEIVKRLSLAPLPQDD